MFSTSVIRKLAPSEEMFAQSQTFFACTVHLRGPVDVEALGLAFDMLLQAHAVLAGHLDKRPDGLHDIVHGHGLDECGRSADGVAGRH